MPRSLLTFPFFESLVTLSDCLLPALLPELEQPKQYGTVSYELSKIDIQNGYYTGGVEVEDGRLILQIQKNSVDTTGPIGSVEVTVKTTISADFSAIVTVTLCSATSVYSALP